MSIGQALLAEGGRDGAHLRGQVRLAILGAGGLMVVGTMIATVGRGAITALYGTDYREAAEVLRALVAASIPLAVTSVDLTEARVLHRSAATVAITLTLAVAILGPALLVVPDHGLGGAAASFLGGNVVAAVVALAVHLTGRVRAAEAVAPPSTADLEAETI